MSTAGHLERIERDAWSDLYRADVPGLDTEVLEIGGGTLLLAPKMDHPYMNRGIGIAVDRLGDAVDAFESRGVERWFLHVDEADLERALDWGRPRGIVAFHRTWVKFAHTGEVPVLETSVQLEDARPEHAAEVGRLYARGFSLPEATAPLFAAMVGRPGWAVSIAVDGGHVVGLGSLFLGGEGAYLAGGTTASSHRRRGIQGALMARRLRQAYARGARWVGTETGEAVAGQSNSSWHNMERCGFRPVSRRPNLVPEGTTWS